MKISFINGSPKPGKSNSELIIDYLKAQIADNEIKVYHITKEILSKEQLQEIRNSDALVVVFPLYVDSIPSHLLQFLITLEAQEFSNKNTMLYCIVNNGFFEGKQNQIAIEQMKHWCQASNLIWGQGAGIGSGETIPFLIKVPLGRGPNKNLGLALKELSSNLLNLTSGEDILVSPNLPRFLWKILANLLVWRPRSKSNGLKRKDLYRTFP